MASRASITTYVQLVALVVAGWAFGAMSLALGHGSSALDGLGASTAPLLGIALAGGKAFAIAYLIRRARTRKTTTPLPPARVVRRTERS